ncbi:MAG: YgjV family protein [Ruminococcaceae bacterium]|nr:YgjV family protein [Oscillospiraceae bacterium]
MATLSYISSFIATILGLIEPFGKKMKTILTLNFLGNLLVGISYLFGSDYSGAAICFTACVQVLINYSFDVKQKKLPLWLIIIHAVIFLTVNIITFAHWYDIIALAAAMLFVLSVAQSNAKYYRVLYVTNSFLWIFYDFLAGAYANLGTHIVLFIATSIAIYIRDKKAK